MLAQQPKSYQLKRYEQFQADPIRKMYIDQMIILITIAPVSAKVIIHKDHIGSFFEIGQIGIESPYKEILDKLKKELEEYEMWKYSDIKPKTNEN